ncbi:hypothetical protein L1276_002592 [Flavobacterium sp. HSC-32F16]|nr:hypothetical protein [Flavobacterium sp. HSC-32F16]
MKNIIHTLLYPLILDNDTFNISNILARYFIDVNSLQNNKTKILP